MPDYHVLDDALDLIRGSSPELKNGLSNHAPMAVEAICTMDRADVVKPWLERYRKGFVPAPKSVARIVPDRWRAALGRPERFSDWLKLIADEVRHEAWPVVLDRWVARLAPGISAAATHGVIRTGHAVRALDQATTAQRLNELTEGLAYWASTYQSLSTNAVSHAETARPTEAIGQVPILPVERRRFTGTITSALAALDDFPDFADAINLADLEGNPHTVLSEIPAALTGVYLANARDVLTTIVFIHGVTSAAAVRSLAPHLSVATMGTTIRYLWQAGCGLYAAFGSRPSPAAVIANSGESRARAYRPGGRVWR